MMAQRLGVSNEKELTAARHDYWNTDWLNTMGSGSRNADVCVEYYFLKGEYISTLKLYHVENYGIVGTMFETNLGNYQVYGNIAADDKTYVFDER